MADQSSPNSGSFDVFISHAHGDNSNPNEACSRLASEALNRAKPAPGIAASRAKLAAQSMMRATSAGPTSSSLYV